MDKENKDMATTGNTSYDPDAAELLKDLEDDDDDLVPRLQLRHQSTVRWSIFWRPQAIWKH